MSIEELFASLGIDTPPVRWGEFYDEVMADFDKHGCPLTDPEYYERLHAEYDVFPRYLDVFKEAAAAVGRREDLSRYLALLAYAISDRTKAYNNLASFTPPKPPAGEHDLATDMVTALATASMIPYAHRVMTERGIPADMVLCSLRSIEGSVGTYAERNGGHPGFHLIGWHQRTIDGNLYIVGSLQIEVFATFGALATVYRNAAGDSLALAEGITLHRDGYALGAHGFLDEEGAWTANVTETEDAYVGYPYDERGYVQKTPVTLKKSEWSVAIRHGDPIVSLHIPKGTDLKDESITETMVKIRAFCAEYFPDYAYRGFYCYSWMMDPQLDEMLGEHTNIVKFRRRYHPMTYKSAGHGVFGFIFQKPDMNFSLDDLPETTTLERKLKAHYKNGGAIYEMPAYFF
ncbi:MAG: hypothetical protein IJF73_06410 [Clostridia bacterium]|nr:hypothetical protein [Clostridia bacterium]